MPEKIVNDTKNEDFQFQTFWSTDSFTKKLQKDFDDRCVIVEFECDGFIKKACGRLVCIGHDFLELSRAQITIFSSGTCDPDSGCACAETECVQKILIKFEKVCAVELLPEQGCPCP
jgi:hypothetical protein